MVEFAKIRVTRKLDDERAIWCFSTFSNIKRDIKKFRPFLVIVTLVRPSTWWKLNTDAAQLVLWFVDAAPRLQWFTDDAQLILGLTDADRAPPRAYSGSPAFRFLTLATPTTVKRLFRSRLRHSRPSSRQVLCACRLV